MDILDELRSLKDNRQYDRDRLEAIADKMENEIGQASMWSTLRPGFSADELLENLIYIAKENEL